MCLWMWCECECDGVMFIEGVCELMWVELVGVMVFELFVCFELFSFEVCELFFEVMGVMEFSCVVFEKVSGCENLDGVLGVVLLFVLCLF